MDEGGQLETSGLGGNGPGWSPVTPNANRRAVRCDRESPCSHCISAKVVCIYTPVQPPKKRTRILLTPQYERKIDLIDSRLEKAIRLLEKLQASELSDGSSRPPGNSQISTQTPLSVSTPASDSTQTKWAHGQVVEGDSSLAAHSAFANEFLQKVVATNSLQASSPELCDTLDELSSILTQGDGAGDELAYPHARPIQRANLPGYEMPPLKKAIALIRMAKAKQLVGSGWIYEFLPFQRFTDMCLDVYFNDNHSEANFITVNAGLYSLFWDYSFQVVPQEKDECITHAHLCRDNLETVLSNLPLHLSATSDTILALLFGAFYAIELSKPSLSWTLSAKGSELCQTLGYHRLASVKNDKQEDFQYKQFLFWSIYFIDKSLSLRLGRPSTIPDWDITVPRPSTNDSHSEPVLAYFVLSIETARCQGNIYEMLYSPNSMTQPDQVKQSRVEALVSDLRNLEAKTWETNTKWFEEAKEQSGEDLINFFYISENVLRLSLLTLVHRAAPPLPGSVTTFNYSCIAAARATLEKHEECIALMHKSATSYLATYMHWTLLFAPFIPFIVIFCHVIETQDEADLARLQAFVTSIQSASSISGPAAKLHRLFQVLCRIAMGYVKFRFSATPLDGWQDSSKIDTYLDALGFSSASACIPGRQHHLIPQHDSSNREAETNDARTSADAKNDELRVMNPMMWMANSAELEEWLENNEVMTGSI
ncbi:putative transcription factor [Aspergillus fischeri NRRL 181]|uniref:Fungal specific transcription factor, putative n=1 Tax=Neosartorya fischeri (strain ATCC 1020 / DSM 3700 / CBS 544.65 / FGSC A1164 / JCM 1740 / NRRL 181 / WB 181) TaxID=331117 RepID=A1D5L0_NEOFI|nr:fungal specific transcription factor, putative [Aspergillus fischeri NRRL 181]EAW21004.1 fungal specific transcription factor, putative [Aspergillus fischeri NRRL 181]